EALNRVPTLGIALGPGYEVGESSSAAAARPAGGLRADYGFVATMDREIRSDSEREVRYRITNSWDEIVETLQGAPETGYDFRDAEGRAEEIYRDERGQLTTLQGQVTTLQGQVTTLQGQQGPVGGPVQPELLEEAGSSS
ncbi:hypothetical protein Tco_1498537, partial [Tanacetum coccineum]